MSSVTQAQFGHISTLAQPQILSAAGTAAKPSTPTLLEPVRPAAMDPMSGPAQALAAASPYAMNPALLGYPRLAGLADYANPLASQGLLGLGAAAEASANALAAYNPLAEAFTCSSYAQALSSLQMDMGTIYDLKDNPAWRAMSPAACYPYDPTLAGYYAGYGGIDYAGIRRKNATRETTSTLKAWLNEHRKNPYPTKGEKIMLAIITKMTLTQVSTWFANARRRLKKDNKMTWSNRDREDGENSDDDNDGDKNASSSKMDNDANSDNKDRDHKDTDGSVLSAGPDSDLDDDEDVDVSDEGMFPPTMFPGAAERLRGGLGTSLPSGLSLPGANHFTNHLLSPTSSLNKSQSHTQASPNTKPDSSSSTSSPSSSSHHNNNNNNNNNNSHTESSQAPAKPRIWSMVDVLSSPHASHAHSVPTTTSDRVATSLSFPLAMKAANISVTGHQGAFSPAVANLRSWVERGPYGGLAVSVAHPGPLTSSPYTSGMHHPHPHPAHNIHTLPGSVNTTQGSPLDMKTTGHGPGVTMPHRLQPGMRPTPIYSSSNISTPINMRNGVSSSTGLRPADGSPEPGEKTPSSTKSSPSPTPTAFRPIAKR